MLMRKSLRKSSSSSGPPSVAITPPAPPAKNGSLRGKARRVSESMKNTLKRLLNLTRTSPVVAILPSQHVESHKYHALDSFDCELSSRDANSTFEYEMTGSSAVKEVLCRQPCIHDNSSSQKLRSHRGSVESFHSDKRASEDKSRVTSWTSSEQSTLASRGPARGDWEKQRLSVIRENGPHAPSSSLARLDAFRVALSRRDAASGQMADDNLSLMNAMVDSQRVYSALMKRMDETAQLATIVEQQRRSSGGRTVIHEETLSPESLDMPARKQNTTPQTIQWVVSAPPSSQSAEENRPLDRTRRNSGPSQDQHTLKRIDSANSTSSNSAFPIMCAEDDPTLLKPGMHVLGPLRDTVQGTGAFFGSPSRHLFRTTSPYRRALQATMQEAGALATGPTPKDRSEGMAVLTDSPPGQATNGDQHTKDDCHGGAYDSESVYSGNTDEGEYATSAVLDQFPKPPSGPAGERGSLSSHRRGWRQSKTVSSVNSIDWKTWLAANVSKLEPLAALGQVNDEEDAGGAESPRSFASVLHSVPKMLLGHGHIREPAQIGTDESPPLRAAPPPPPPPPPPPMPPHPRRPPPAFPALSTLEQNIVRPSPSRQSFKRSSSSLAAAGGLVENENPRSWLEDDVDLNRRDSATLPSMPPLSISQPPLVSPASDPSSMTRRKMSGQGRTGAEPSNPAIQTPHQALAAAVARKSRSLARIRSLNRLRATATETGSPRALRTATPTSASMASSPGLTLAVERHFGAAAASQAWHVTEPSGGMEYDSMGLGGSRSAIGSPYCPQSAESRHMVDQFLNSRRRRMVGSEETAAFI